MALLRARFELRLDVERARTQDSAQELQQAYNEAIARQVSSLQASFEEEATLQCTAEEQALRQERARSEAAAAALQRAGQSLQAELQAARLAGEAEADALAAARLEEQEVRAHAAADMCATRASEEQLLAAAQEEFRERREEQVSEVVARLQLDHFQVSAQAAKESELAARWEAEAEESWSELRELRGALEPPRQESVGTQTWSWEVPATPTPEEYETLGLRLADAEARLLAAEKRLSDADAAEAKRLEAVEQRVLRTLQLKDDLVQQLKDELLAKDVDILEARQMLACLRSATHHAPAPPRTRGGKGS